MKLVIFAGVLTIILAGCIFQQALSTSVPNDLDIRYRRGSCKAEWGQIETEIFANGTKISGNTTTTLSQTKLLEILNGIEKSGFYSLNEYYSDLEIHDGSCRFISVTANNKTKTVSVSNMPAPEAFDKVADVINNA